MKIHKLSRIVAMPFFVLAVVIGYYAFKHPLENYLIWGLLPAAALILIYLFSPQIDYWWLGRNPVELDQQITDLLHGTNPDYVALSQDQKNEFNKRLTLFTTGKEFIAKGMEKENMDVPFDVQNMISQIPVTMTMGRDDFTFRQFDRIVLYKHPFGSPLHRFLHTMETHAEDGVVILSLEHVQAAMMNPGHHYDVGYHAFAEAFTGAYPKENYPDLPNDIWDSIEKISPQNKQMILSTLGFQNVDPMPVLITLYFRQKEKFQSVLPKVAVSLKQIFNL